MAKKNATTELSSVGIVEAHLATAMPTGIMIHCKAPAIGGSLDEYHQGEAEARVSFAVESASDGDESMLRIRAALGVVALKKGMENSTSAVDETSMSYTEDDNKLARFQATWEGLFTLVGASAHLQPGADLPLQAVWPYAQMLFHRVCEEGTRLFFQCGLEIDLTMPVLSEMTKDKPGEAPKRARAPRRQKQPAE